MAWGILKPSKSGCPGERQPGSRQALFTLSCINALNFADRYVPAAVKTNLEKDLGLDDWQSALPSMAMTVVFTVFSMVFGLLADRQLVDRRVLLASGIAFWSFATALGGYAQNLQQLILFRALVGVGEAAFATVASPMLADFYPGPQRNRAYTFFGLSAPLGAAIGFGIGSCMGSQLGWRCAFFVCGFPGIAIAFTVLLLNDPPRGINDEAFEEDELSTTSSSEGSTELSLETRRCLHEEMELLSNPHFALATAGTVAIQFAIGGLSEWYPTFLQRYAGMKQAYAGLTLSASCVLSGIGGTVLGSKVADLMAQQIGSKAYFLVPAVFMLPGAILTAFAVNLGRGSSLQILLCHVLGDVISPPIIGAIADVRGLRTGLQLCWVAVLVAGFMWGCGYKCLTAPPISIKPKPQDSGTIGYILSRGKTWLDACYGEESAKSENSS
ncbi:unnamed protein product [Effrenium voratum]|nr:unnamed protein product [Effrenium voratum]